MTLYNVRNTTIVSIIVPESRLDQYKVTSHCCLIICALALQGVKLQSLWDADWHAARGLSKIAEIGNPHQTVSNRVF